LAARARPVLIFAYRARRCKTGPRSLGETTPRSSLKSVREQRTRAGIWEAAWPFSPRPRRPGA